MNHTATQVQHAADEAMTWLARVFHRTSQHEGTYDSLNLNGDGQGLSFGRLQWAQRPGALGKLLSTMFLADPVGFQRFFGTNFQALLNATSTPGVRPVEGKHLYQEPWITRFKQAGQHPPFQQVQDQFGAQGVYMQYAVQATRILGLPTERTLSMCYDTAVQQGPETSVRIANRVRTSLNGRTATARQVLELYMATAAAPFRRKEEPTKPAKEGFSWRLVGKEWHKFAGSIDLYADIVRRRSAILNDATIADATIPLPAQAAAV